MTAYTWDVITRSVQGARHVRQGLPNQDAVHSRSEVADTPLTILAVSDGHGSPRCFRSAIGARFAVAAATEVTERCLLADKDATPSKMKDFVETRLPAEITRNWTKLVEQYHLNRPFTDEELDKLEKESGPKARAAATDPSQALVAYGATLLLAAVTDSYLFCLQLGDGDIVTVTDPDNLVDRPMPPDPTLFADVTTSLCQADAEKLFRTHFQALQGVPPSLIMVSTDGYLNAFKHDADFLKVASDLVEILRDQGLDYVKANVESWLKDATDHSGDDVTLGLIVRRNMATATNPDETAEPPSPVA